MTKKRVISGVAAAVLICLLVSWCFFEVRTATKATEISMQDAETVLNEQFDKAAVTKSLKYIADNNYIKVKNISYGDEKDVILDCTV